MHVRTYRTARVARPPWTPRTRPDTPEALERARLDAAWARAAAARSGFGDP